MLRATLATLASSAVIAPVAAVDSYEWKTPKAGDRRSPCPMVNTLANHGYLPRTGLNVSMDDLVQGFAAALNLDEAATRLVGAKALLTSTTGDNNTFNLDDLDEHGVIEHDGSLSRNDIYFGDNHSFNATIWAATASHFTEDTISIATAAAARSARLEAAAAANPEFNMTSSDVQFSYIETALYLSIFGNVDTGDAITQWVHIMFEEERLPVDEGFVASDTPITTAQILGMASKVAAA